MAKVDNGVVLPAESGNKGATNALNVGENVPSQRRVELPDRSIAQVDGSFVTVRGNIREDR